MLKKISSLIYIIILALVLRLVGINHGFPFIFHPDEPSVIRSALGIRFALNPKHFDWPHLFIYLNYALYMHFSFIRGLLTNLNLQQVLPLLWNDAWIYYLISRVFAAVLGGLTVIPIYFSGKKLFNTHVGILSALVFALIPYHVWNSHYALIDVPMVFFLAWSLYFAVRLFKRTDIKNFALAGLFVGLSASTKYNGALACISIPLAVLLKKDATFKEKFSLKVLGGFVVSGISAIVGFLLGTPFALLDYKTFIRTDGPAGALWQFKNVGHVSIGVHISQFIDTVTHQLMGDFGYTFFVIFALYFVYALVTKKFTRELAFLYIISWAFIYYVSGFEKTRAQYFMIVYPFVALSVGYAISKLSLKNKILTGLLILLIFAVPLFFNIKNDVLYVREDTRVILYNKLMADTTMPNTVFYEDVSLKSVVEALKLSKTKKISGLQHLFGPGYYVASDIAAPQKMAFINVSEAFSIGSYLRRGPDIYVYKIN